MKDISISNDIIYIGSDDKNLDLFESQYAVPNGISYNSYIIIDEKIAIIDTIDSRKSEEWMKNLEQALNGKAPDYIIVSHMEPDHSACIQMLIEKYPQIKIVGTNRTFAFIPQFFDIADLESRRIEVKEGETLELGKHKLRFIMAPMVHWPEVMMEYEETEQVLFSADAFGKFGTLDTDEEWDCEARRYYFNIVGKYGMQVQAVLKKLSNIEIKTICPLHGPIIKENLEHYLKLYDTWSSYKPESEGVFIACASIHGNTMKAVEELKTSLEQKGINKVVISDLSREDFAECIEDAFRYGIIVLASSTYNMSLFPPMEQLLNQLKEKNYQNRKVGIIENGTWAPNAAKCIREKLEQMKDIEIIEPIVSIKSTLNNDSRSQLELLAKSIVNLSNIN